MMENAVDLVANVLGCSSLCEAIDDGKKTNWTVLYARTAVGSRWCVLGPGFLWVGPKGKSPGIGKLSRVTFHASGLKAEIPRMLRLSRIAFQTTDTGTENGEVGK